MKRWIVVVVTVLLCLTPVYAAEDNNLPQGTIELQDIDMSVLETGTATDIEKELYPSGMELPTKWLDLSSFLPFTGQFEPEIEVYNLLQANWNTDGKYTYAEYSAAKMFIGCVKLEQMSANNDLSTSVHTAVQSGTIGLLNPTKNVVLGENQLDYVHKLFQMYDPVLQEAAQAEYPSNCQDYTDMVTEQAFPFVLTLSFDFPWLTAYDGSLDSDVLSRGAKFFDNLAEWYKAMGLEMKDSSKEISWTIPTTDEKLSLADTSSISEVELGNNDVTALDKYVAPTELRQSGHMGLRDIVGVIAGVTVAWSVVALLVITWRRKRS